MNNTEGMGRRRPDKDVRRDIDAQKHDDNIVEEQTEDIEPEYSCIVESEDVPKEKKRKDFDDAIKVSTERYVTTADALVRDLGPANRYDSLAMRAQIAGYEFGNRDLVMAGSELADLIRRYSYDDERFYRVIAKAKEIEKSLDELAKEYVKLDGMEIKSEDGRSLFVNCYVEKGVYYVEVFTNRRLQSRERSLRHEMFRKLILEKVDVDVNGEQQFEVDHIGSARFTKIFHLNDVGKRVYMDGDWEHENGEDSGFRDLFFFPDRGSALKVWAAVKELAESISVGS